MAVDLGGTKIASAIISAELQVMAREYAQTQAEAGPPAVIDRMVASVHRLLESSGRQLSELDCIGIAAAGILDTARGVVTYSPNLPGWEDVPLREIMRERFRVDTFIINDASAAALGEHRLGVGRGTSNMVYLTVSTGIGGGIITDGRLYQGENGCAGELGHMTIDVGGPTCSCGRDGCLEALASGGAIAREAVRRISGGEPSELMELVGGNLEAITAEEVARAARGGDRLASDIIFRAAFYLGVGLVNLIHIFNPAVIAIGGGLSKMGDQLLEPARRVVAERAFKFCERGVRIVTARLGDDAGVLGAAVYAAEKNKTWDER